MTWALTPGYLTYALTPGLKSWPVLYSNGVGKKRHVLWFRQTCALTPSIEKQTWFLLVRIETELDILSEKILMNYSRLDLTYSELNKLYVCLWANGWSELNLADSKDYLFDYEQSIYLFDYYCKFRWMELNWLLELDTLWDNWPKNFRFDLIQVWSYESKAIHKQ